MGKIIQALEEAKKQGLKTYFTGTPCVNGHISERFVKGNGCKKCVVERTLRYQKKVNYNKIVRDRMKNETSAQKELRLTKRKQHYKKNANKIISQTIAYQKSEKGKQIKRRANKKWVENNREKYNEVSRIYQGKRYREDEDYRKRTLEYHSKYSKKPDQIARRKNYINKRYAKNLDFKLGLNLSNRIKKALKGYNKGSSRTIKLIGCSIAELKKHLEKQFLPSMTWENHNIKGWHIDHIRPISSFNLSDPEQQKICFHYSNLQPLWAEDNLRKNKKYDPNNQ
jgi:hypothetical protein